MGTTAQSNRVWQGDPSAVAVAREQYKDNPQTGLIPYAIALYSFRRDTKYAVELMKLRRDLRFRAAALTNPALTPRGTRIAETADVLSTHLEWISRQTALGDVDRRQAHEAAIDACMYGIEFARSASSTDHTLPLLHLTAARLCLNDLRTDHALEHLRYAQSIAARGNISDPRQLVRVYTKLGLLYRKADERVGGVVWGMRAIAVRGVPFNVRLKALAALLGIDR